MSTWCRPKRRSPSSTRRWPAEGHAMYRRLEPGVARRQLLRRALGASVLVAVLGRIARAAEPEIIIDNFTFAPTPLKVKVGATVTWINHDDIPHSIRSEERRVG